VVITVLRGEEATVKWLRREGTTALRLRSQNWGYECIVVPAGAVSVRTLLVILQKPREAKSPSSRQLGE
jgi:SOS-response transcriptional repressor LexA